MNRLVLIDGNAILHRAYHALPPQVGATYGFISILIKLFHDFHPSHMAVAFDRAAPTFRKKLFKDYQAKRPKMEDELVNQIGKVHEVVSSFGIPIYELDGFEADDIIGTISKKCQMLNAQCQIIIVTGDRDILQLVRDERVFVFMPTKGISQGKLYGEKEVVERMGVPPSQIPNFKALAGDPSDNYPGVPGIGPKTAIKLLEKYKTMQKILQTLSEKDKKSARMSLDLATIRTNVPIQFDFEKARVSTLNTPSSRAAIENLHFPSLLKRLGEKSEESKKETSEQQQLF